MFLQRITAASLFAAVFIASFTAKASDANAPSWLTGTPNTPSNIYSGVGIGKNTHEARNAALADIANQIANTVESSSKSVVRKVEANSSTEFNLTVTGQSIPIQFNAVKVVDNYSFPNKQQVGVLVHVHQSDIQKSLQSILQRASALTFPQNGTATQQLLWILRYQSMLEQANVANLAYQQITGRSSEADFDGQLQQLLQAEQQLGIRIIASRDLEGLVGALSEHLPSATPANLWLQLSVNKQQRKLGNKIQERWLFTAELTEPKAPFRMLHTQTLNIIGTGDTQPEASEDAQKQLITLLKQPTRDWLFNDSRGKGNE